MSSFFTSRSSGSSDADASDVYTADEVDVVDDHLLETFPHPPGGKANTPKASASFSYQRNTQHPTPPSSSSSFTSSSSSSSARRPTTTRAVSTPPQGSNPRSPDSEGSPNNNSGSFSRFGSFFRPQPSSAPSSTPTSPSSGRLLAALEDGMEVIKLDRHGGMKRKRVYLRVDAPNPSAPPSASVWWDSDKVKKHKAFIAAGECRLELGCSQGWFLHIKAKERAKLQPQHCFSLLGEKRSLDLVCKTQADASAWIAALSPYLPTLASLPPVMEGRLLRVFGSSLPAVPLQRPQGLAISPITGELFVCSGDQVHVFDRANATKAVWGRKGGGEADDCLRRPSDLAVSYEDALVFVCDTGNSRVQVLEVSGKLRESWKDSSSATPSQPVAIHVSGHSNRLYIADHTLHKVQVYTAEGSHITSIGASRAAKEQGEIARLGGVAVWGQDGADSRVFVVNSSAHRVDVFSAEGRALFSFGKKGAGKGSFFTPKGIAVDQVHRLVYVADSDNHRVQLFNLDGEYVGDWGREGSELGDFQKPTGIAVCPLTGLVYVADTNNHRIQVFY